MTVPPLVPGNSGIVRRLATLVSWAAVQAAVWVLRSVFRATAASSSAPSDPSPRLSSGPRLRRAERRPMPWPSATPVAMRPGRRVERGQSTVEYALLLLGAAAIALVVVAWVTRTDLIGRLFDTVIGRILNQA